MKSNQNVARRLALALGLITLVVVLFSSREVTAKTTAKTVTVAKINQASAKKVHQTLMKGKAFKLKVKVGKMSKKKTCAAVKKQYKKLFALVAKQTDYEMNMYPIVYFSWNDCFVEGKGSYWGIEFSKDRCQDYIYGIKIAKRAYTQFKKSVKSHIAEQQAVYDKMLAETIYYGDGSPEGIEWTKTAITDSLKNMKELSSYLSKTKFCDLSETMKARLLLNVAQGSEFLGSKRLMSEVEFKYGIAITFKALYNRLAYGRCKNFTTVVGRLCAVFGIGDYDLIAEKNGKYTNFAISLRLETLGGETRYVISDNGLLDPEGYNSYKNRDIYLRAFWFEKQRDKRFKYTINEDEELLRAFGSFRVGSVHLYDAWTGEELPWYNFDVPKEEW